VSKRLKKLNWIEYLELDCGTFSCPPDVMELYKKAPKLKVFNKDSGDDQEVVDGRTALGRAYLRRVEELNRAVTLLWEIGWQITDKGS